MGALQNAAGRGKTTQPSRNQQTPRSHDEADGTETEQTKVRSCRSKPQPIVAVEGLPMSDVPRVVRALTKCGAMFCMEQDKIPGFWVITAWPHEDVILRVRIHHHTNEEPCHIHCEIRIRGVAEWHWLATITTTLWDILQVEEFGGLDPEEFPSIWRSEFIEMARRWGVCAWIVEFGSVTEVRYQAEPESSRDCLEFPDGCP
jgi:hypothetical protein